MLNIGNMCGQDLGDKLESKFQVEVFDRLKITLLRDLKPGSSKVLYYKMIIAYFKMTSTIALLFVKNKKLKAVFN